MRCLYCNKKLSLLKLAKGDDFCSPEHFDAHQLQLSKDAINRLMNVAVEESSKPRLISKKKEDIQEQEPTVEIRPEEAAALRARFIGLVPPAPLPTAKVPPYAPFALSQVPFTPLDAASPMENQTMEPVEPPRELAFPVHGVETTICILNLYLYLKLEGAEPKNWTSARNMILPPDDFRLNLIRPPLNLEAAFPKLADEMTRKIEATAPEITAPEPQVIETAPETAPVIPTEPASVTPIELPEPAPARLAFKIAPSFMERVGTPILISTPAGAIPERANIAPILDSRRPPRLDSCDGIPNSVRFAQNTSLGLRDSAGKPVESGREVPTQTAFLRPASNQHVCEKAWRPTTASIVVSLPALETPCPPVRSQDCEMPAPGSLSVRPDATEPRKVDPGQLLAGSAPLETVSLFRNVLETRPFGKDPLFWNPPADAIKGALPPTLASFPDPRPLPAAWQDRTAFFPLPDATVAWSPWPQLPLEPLQYASRCRKINGREVAKLPAPFDATAKYRSTAWPQADSTRQPIPAVGGATFTTSTMLAEPSNMPARSLKAPPLPPSLPWNPHAPAAKAIPVVKTLPVRSGFILPAPRNWPRLQPLPR